MFTRAIRTTAATTATFAGSLLLSFMAHTINNRAEAQQALPTPSAPTASTSTTTINNAPSATATAASTANTGPISVNPTSNTAFYGGLGIGLSSGPCTVSFGFGALGFQAAVGVPMASCNDLYTAANTLAVAIREKDVDAQGAAYNTLATISLNWASAIKTTVPYALSCPKARSGIFYTQALTPEQCDLISIKDRITPAEIDARVKAIIAEMEAQRRQRPAAPAQQPPCDKGCKPTFNQNQTVYGIVVNPPPATITPPAATSAPAVKGP